jgi:hypothetical protein
MREWRKPVDRRGKTGRPLDTSPQSNDGWRAEGWATPVGARRKGTRRLAFLLLLLALLFQGPVSAENGREGQEEPGHVETYRYQAVPTGRERDTEQITTVLSFKDDTIGFTSTSVSEKEKEKVALEMTGKGDLTSGTRSLTSSSGRVTKGRIWREGNKVYTRRGKKTTSASIPKEAILAIKGSLLVLLRSFPYGRSDQWNLLMIEFSGKSISATVRQTGTERISVPAGEFLCYRVEVRFHVLILNPVVLCWVDTEKPHNVIKSVGKRDLFGPTYVTSLLGKE